MSPQVLARADQRCRTLELLDGQQPECVAHQDGHAGVRSRASEGRTQSAVRERERGKAEVGLGLAASCREPEQISDSPIGMTTIGQGGEVQQNERQLERTPPRRHRRGAVSP